MALTIDTHHHMLLDFFFEATNEKENPVSGDRLKGTPEEYKTALTNSLGVYGTYTDENGDFLEKHVLGSTFQNMNRTSRGRHELTEKVDGSKMSETLKNSRRDHG